MLRIHGYTLYIHTLKLYCDKIGKHTSEILKQFEIRNFPLVYLQISSGSLKFLQTLLVIFRPTKPEIQPEFFLSNDCVIISENYTEESLNLHEHQIRILRGFYEENKAIFKLVEKREMMWKRLMEFEVK